MTPRELLVTTSTVALFGATLIGAAHVAHTRQCRETAGTPRAVVLDCPTSSPAGQRKGKPLPASETAPTVARVAPRATPSAASRTRPLVQPPRPVESGTQLSSTSYCETGVMANGQHTRRGLVAGNRWKLGTVLHVSDSPYGPGDFTVLDHIGHGSDLDFAMPGDCAGARQWGRRTVRAQVVR